jgi:Protein of unknown function (DUF2844)
MKRNIYALLVCLGLVAASFSTAQRAQAALGESADSVESDRKALSAVRRAATTLDAYTIQEVKSDAATVREYVSSSGVVFAVAWNGLSHPDLTPLLGSYAGEYKKALRQTRRTPGRRHLQVKAERVVVEKWGHMRNLQGRAYDPALIPQGVSVDEIK